MRPRAPPADRAQVGERRVLGRGGCGLARTALRARVILILLPRRPSSLSETRQEPAPGGDRGPAGQPDARAAGPVQKRDIPFDAFLRTLYPAAKARNDTEWLEWYEGWLKNMPEDGREDYIERSREEYERRTGETIGEYMDRRLDERAKKGIREDVLESMREDMRRNIEDATNRHIAESFNAFRREYIDMAVRRSF